MNDSTKARLTKANIKITAKVTKTETKPKKATKGKK
jgi:hypothetical protein